MIAAAAKVKDPGKYEGKPGKRRVISFKGQDFIGHKQDLLHAVALHYLCSTVVTSTTGPDPRSYVFGYDSDLDLTEMLFTSLVLQAAHALLAEDIPSAILPGRSTRHGGPRTRAGSHGGCTTPGRPPSRTPRRPPRGQLSC